ncbi:MAG TPA: flagellar hook-associated protein FlgL [Oligoflexia bacterium]|nr:flagellar hook-associated protein FlgL [Oligoflexia bacterium]HMP47441.1 flagellar hook-associated protein FlgL [Oligoflexia bacterium]
MSTRVSTGQYIGAFINQLNSTRNDLESVRRQLSSGLKVVNPSDDPGRSGTILNLQSVLQRIQSHQQRVTFATNYIEAQENAVSTANEVLMRVQELGTQAANGTYSVEVRRQIADEVYQLRDQLAGLANTSFQGVYVYGGFNDSSPPFNENATFYPTPLGTVYPQARSHFELSTALGQNSTRAVQISDTESIRVNTAARDVFLDAINAVERLGRALAGARTDLIDADGDGSIDDPDPAGTHLPWNLPDEYDLQSAAIRDALNAIKSARVNNIETELSSIGARVNRLQQTNQILDTLKLNAEKSRSSIQDADIFEASTQFANLQSSLEALLASGARITSLSLLDFI